MQKIDVNQFIEGRAPIHWASDYGQREIIDFLIQKGAKIDVSQVEVVFCF